MSDCSAFSPEERVYYNELRKELTADLTYEKISNGYTFIYPKQPLLILKIAEWISLENRCCPFITFSLQVSGEAEKIRLELTGNEEIQQLLRLEINLN
ncbi:hypothetical protein MMJ63_14180 [Bacillus vallismortis]|nr:hypothetical protein [Bacillus vallismortis]